MEPIIAGISKELLQFGVLGIFAIVAGYCIVKLFNENARLNSKLVEVLKESSAEIADIHKEYFDKNTQADIRRDAHVNAITSNFLTEIQRLHATATSERDASINAFRLLGETNKALESAINKLAEAQKDTAAELKQLLLRGTGNGR
jgi:hypothetical protein